MDRTLLLVDDEPNILSALYRLMRREGYTILRATSGREGLELLKEHEINVILSDQRMPEMTGVEFLRQVKELYPDTVRLVLSGYTELNSVTDAINEGAIYKFLTKPWDDDLLRKNMREAFEYHELQRHNEQLARDLTKANASLSSTNATLSRIVETQAESAKISRRALEISHTIIENLPIGLVGIGADDIVVLANDMAHQMLQPDGGTLVGVLAAATLPAPLNSSCDSCGDDLSSVTLKDGRSVRVCIKPLSGASDSEGRFLVLIP